jgi:hypothetical protein
MESAPDPRLVKLRRLQLTLDTVKKQLDEFEARVFKRLQKAGVRAASAKSAMPVEYSFANHIAAGMAKLRQAR